jgi:predicted alpha/beta-hydrolase family hydrolase
MPELCFSVALRIGGAVSTVLDTPAGFRAGAAPAIVLAHGAGNDLRSAFLETFAASLSARGLAVVRFNFPYKEIAGQRPPDKMDVLVETFREVVAAAASRTGAPPGPLFVGGKSMGARVASVLVARGLVRPTGLVFLGYPLHPPGKPEEARTAHLPEVGRPMLFVQGTRDPFGTVEEVQAVRHAMKLPGALHPVEGGDHSYALPKSQSSRQAAAFDEASRAIVEFVRRVLAAR